MSNHARGIQSHTTGGVTGASEGFRAYQSGTFTWQAEYQEDTSGRVPEGQKALDFVGIILDVTEFVLFAQRFYRVLPPDATLRGIIRLQDTQGRSLTCFGHGKLHGHNVCGELEVHVEVKSRVAVQM